MKKNILIILLLFILFSCSKNETINNSSLSGQTILNKNNLNTQELLNNSGSENVKKVENSDIKKQEDIKKIKVYSPVYTLTGETITGTTKVEVVFSGSTKKDNYFLKQFKSGDKSFTTNLRLDYGNIEKGANNYEVKFYNEKDLIIEIKKYLIVAEFEEVKVKNKIIYISKKRDERHNTKNENFTFFGCLNYNATAIGYEKILIKNGNSFYIYEGCLIFSEKDDYLFTFKETNHKDKVLNYPLYDVYLNDKKVISSYRLFSSIHELFVNNNIVYEKNSNIIYYKYVIFYNTGIDSWDFFHNNMMLNLNTGKEYGYYTFSNGGKNWSINLEKKHKESFIESKYFYNTNEIGNIKNNNKIVTFSHKNGTQEKSNYFSVFKIEKDIDGIKYGKNFIYNNYLNLKINQEQFYYDTQGYDILLGSKNFKLDYKDLVEKNYQMINLLDFDKNNLYNKFYGVLYLEKVDNKYILNIGNQKTTKVSKVGIIACGKNEDMIYTEDIDSNYKYNISEELNNKCDIPYKINVYYTDGTKETGEYYILFDY